MYIIDVSGHTNPNYLQIEYKYILNFKISRKSRFYWVHEPVDQEKAELYEVEVLKSFYHVTS